MTRHLVGMQRRALEKAQVEKSEKEVYEQRVVAERAKQVSVKREKEQLQDFLKL